MRCSRFNALPRNAHNDTIVLPPRQTSSPSFIRSITHVSFTLVAVIHKHSRWKYGVTDRHRTPAVSPKELVATLWQFRQSYCRWRECGKSPTGENRALHAVRGRREDHRTRSMTVQATWEVGLSILPRLRGNVRLRSWWFEERGEADPLCIRGAWIRPLRHPGSTALMRGDGASSSPSAQPSRAASYS